MFVKPVVAVALLSSFVAAQFNNITVDPSTVDATTRAQWCEAEFNTCNLLCSKATTANQCDSTTLNFTCTCTANNSAPGLQFYKQTMPTFLCEQEFSICNADAVNAPNSAQAQADCAATEKSSCGQIDPTNLTFASTSSSSSSASSTPTSTGSASGSSATSSSSKAAAATMAAVRNFGTGAFAVGAAAVFGALL